MKEMTANREHEYSVEKIELVTSKTIELLFETDNEYVIYTVSGFALKAGFGETDKGMVATAASELATNILRYAKNGRIVSNIIKNKETSELGIEILAIDNGPGIENLELAMQENFSTQKNSLGFGLASVRRIMDEFFIESELGKGTKVLVRKWKTESPIYPKTL